MSKQDRQGVRTAQDLERKYDLAGLVALKKAVKNSEDNLNKVNVLLQNFVLSAIGTLDNLKEQIDGNITTWFYEGVPMLSSLPASEWTSDDLEEHLGDLYYDRSTGAAYRFVLDDGYTWSVVSDKSVAEALAIANSMSDAADNMRRVFVEQPIPPYDSGDLWLADKQIYICQVSKGEGEFENMDFILAENYTEGTMAKKMGDVLQIIAGSVTTINRTAAALVSKVEKGSVVSEINQSAEEVKIKGEKISLEGTVTANENVKVFPDGSLQAKNGRFEGTIESSSANITGGTVKIETDSAEVSAVGLYYGSNGVSIAPGVIYVDSSEGYSEFASTFMALNDNLKTIFGVGSTQVYVGTDFLVAPGYTKSRVATTKSYNDVLLYCYEMPSPMFGDIGHGVIGEDGLCYIDVDPIFFETVDMKQSYQVFLQSYSESGVYVMERHQEYFVVKGQPGAEFDWEVKAKQLDFPIHRLEEFRPKDDYQETDYIASAVVYLNNYEQEVLSYE